MIPKSGSQPPSEGELANGYSLSQIARNGDGVSLAISGEIEIANAQGFVDEVHWLCDGADDLVCLDLQDCVFIDSSGIRALISLAQEQQARGRTLKLSGVTGAPLKVLGLSGLLDSGLFANEGESSTQRPGHNAPGHFWTGTR